MMLAQQLMLLNHPWRVAGSVSAISYTNDIADFYGDSVTYGYNPSQPSTPLTNRFTTLLCNQYSMIESNFGFIGSGTQIADGGESDVISTNFAISPTNVSVWLAGYNDMRYFGTNAAALADNAAAVESLAAFLAIPTAQKIPYNDTDIANGGIYYSPGWSPVPAALSGLETCNVPGQPAAFFFSGSTLLIGTARLAGTGGSVLAYVHDMVNSVEVTTNGSTNIYSCLRTCTNTAPVSTGDITGNRSYSAGLIVFTNLSNLPHIAYFVPQTANSIFFGWYAAYSTNQTPKVILAGTLKMPEFQYQNSSLAPYTNGSDFAADEYSGIISNAAVTLSSLMLNVKYAPVPALDTNTDWATDYIHPNPSGHLKIKNSLQTAF